MDLFGEEPVSAVEVSALPPVPEAKEGLLHPREMSFCLGHDDVEARLLDLFNSGRMPHGLIFAGQKGIGKATMAYRLAKFLFKHGTIDEDEDSLFGDSPAEILNFDVDAQDPSSRRVASGGHADFISVERSFDAAKNKYKSGVAVDEVRRIPGFLRMTAADGGWRVVIIDDADTMNRSAQNALLKILEEPPKNAILILVTHRLGALIPTIRSRAQVLNFQLLSQDSLESLLSRHDHECSFDDLEMLSMMAEGSVGKAVQYIEEGGLDSLSQILDLLEDCPNWDWPKIHALADSLAGKGRDQAYMNFTDLFLWLFSQLVVAKARGQGGDSKLLQHRALQELLAKSSLEKLLKICENLQAHFSKVNAANLDKRQGVLSVFSIVGA